MISTSNKRRKFGKRLLAIILLATLALLLVLTIIFQIKKDDIARGILLRVNNIQAGELVFEDISFNPLIHFPHVSVALNNISYYEKNASFRQNDKIPIVRLNRIYLSFNLLNLLQGNVHVSQVDLDGGSINLITYADSSVNITNAIAFLPDTLQVTDDDISGESESADFKLDVDQISFINLEISHNNLLVGSHSSYQIYSLDASLSYDSDTIECTVETDMVINKKVIGDKFILQDKPILIKSTFAINKLLNGLIIEPSQFTFVNASFEVQGSIDLTNEGYIDMAIKGYNKDVSVLNILLNEQSTEDIVKGEVIFNGTVKGSLFDGIPHVACSFQINDLEIEIPNSNQKISNFNLKGNIDSGTKTDLSEASLIISKLSAILPKGKLNGRIKIQDFSNPEFDIDLFLKGDIKGLDKVFNLGEIRDLSGVLELQAQFKGSYNLNNNTLDKSKANAVLKFDNVSIQLPDTIKLNNLNGEIAYRDSVLSLTNFSLEFANSNLQMNGSVSSPASFLDIIKAKYSKNSSPQNVLVLGAEYISTYDIDFKFNAHLNDFNRFLPVGITDSLSGVIEIESELKGNFDYANNAFEKKIENLVFKFDSIYAEHPKAGKIEILNGSLALANSIYSFNGLALTYGKSDFLINGSLNNLHYVFLNVDKEIEGNLHIESKLFDFRDFFSWDEKIANAFPYNIRNINLKVSPRTSTKNLIEFINTPRIEFQINQLDADIEDFLPPVSIKTGHFTLADIDSSLNLDFDNFKAVLLDSKISASVIFNAPQTDPNWLTVNADFSNLNPQEIFTYWVSDSLPGYMAGALDGLAHLELVFSNDSIKFDRLDFTTKNLEFVSLSDTININGLRINAKNINYQASSGFIQSLSFNTDLSVDKIRSSILNGEDLEYQVETIDGIYQVTTSDSHLFHGDSHGQMILKPFANPPFYEFNISAEQFGVAHLLHTFTIDSLLTGIMDLDLNMTSIGNNKKEVLENLNGHTAVHGEDLTLTGIDLDKLIDKFKRSQRFTLADVGAIFLMFPAGILVP